LIKVTTSLSFAIVTMRCHLLRLVLFVLSRISCVPST
jgi:hypothetical protein